MLRLRAATLLLLFCCGLARAEEFPIALGAGSDTVFLKTGDSPSWQTHLSSHPALGASLAYDEHMRVREITIISPTDADTLVGKSITLTDTPHYTLAGIAVDDQQVAVLAKLGEPTSRTLKPILYAFDLETFAWVRADTLLIVSFLRTEQKEAKHLKGAVVGITLRKANL